MEKATFSLVNKLKNILSGTFFRTTLLIGGSLLLLLIVFNIIVYFELRHEADILMDTRLRHEIEHIYLSLTIENDTLKIIRPEEFRESDLASITDEPFFLQVFDKRGKILLSSDNIKYIGSMKLDAPFFSDKYLFKDENVNDRRLRVGYQNLFREDGAYFATLKLGMFNDTYYDIIRNIMSINLYLLPLFIVIIFTAGLLITRRIYSPINKIIETANNINASNLNKKISIHIHDEDILGKLTSTLNNLFQRLNDQIKHITLFTDNASHQIMNPLTIINSELEYLLNKSNLSEDHIKSIEILKEQTERIIEIVKSLLIMTKLRGNPGANTVVNLTELTNEIIASYDSEPIDAEIEDDVYIRCHEDYMKILITNLIDNALKYSNYDNVNLCIKKEGKRCVIKVADRGIGVRNEEKKKIFEKFYRSSSAEIAGIKGAGIGLSLVYEIVNSLNGSIEILDNEPQGAIFIIKLPTIELV